MKGLFDKIKTCNKKYIVGLSLLISVIVLITILVVVNFIVRDIKDTGSNLVVNTKDTRADQFELIFDRLMMEASLTSKNNSDKLEESIVQKYSDNLNKLKENLDDENYSELSELAADTVRDRYLNVDTKENTTFIATADGIICDFSYDTADIYKGEKTYRPWKEIINHSIYTEECGKAIKLLLDRTMEPVIYLNKKVPSKYDFSHKSDTIDKYDLKAIYREYGIDALKYFEVLVPSYITNDADIFGQKDIINGERKINYKIILVQRINMYDQIQYHYPNMISNSNDVTKIIKSTDKILCNIFIIVILITAIVIATVVHFCVAYNKYVLVDKKGSEV